MAGMMCYDYTADLAVALYAKQTTQIYEKYLLRRQEILDLFSESSILDLVRAFFGRVTFS